MDYQHPYQRQNRAKRLGSYYKPAIRAGKEAVCVDSSTGPKKANGRIPAISNWNTLVQGQACAVAAALSIGKLCPVQEFDYKNFKDNFYKNYK